MSHKAVIRLAELVTVDVLRDPAAIRPGRELFQRSALQLLNDHVPVIVDHDRTRPIGHVVELAEWPMVDGVWLVARAVIAQPPAWLEPGTAASIGWARLRAQEVSGWTRVLGGLLNEVSVLPPGVEPAESRARVVLLKRAQSSPAAALRSCCR